MNVFAPSPKESFPPCSALLWISYAHDLTLSIKTQKGMAGWTLAMPFDVPKTNVQARYDCKIVGSYYPELFRIARERGIAGLYGGLGPTLIRAFPANAALFLGVEMGKKLFDKIF